MRHNREISADFVTTPTPGRLASLESDVLVPILQAAAVGVSVGLAAGVGVLVLGSPIGDLGHADLQTTLRYIGVLDASKRKPPSMYSFDWAALYKVDVQGSLADQGD